MRLKKKMGVSDWVNLFSYIYYHMEISKSKQKGLKLILIKLSGGLITDVDIFVNYMGYLPELNIMVDIDKDKLPEDVGSSIGSYLNKKYGNEVLTILKMLEIPFRGDVSFEVLNN